MVGRRYLGYAYAEPLFRRSLAIREKALGPPESDLGFSGGQSAPERRRASVGNVGALRNRLARLKAVSSDSARLRLVPLGFDAAGRARVGGNLSKYV